MGVDRTLADLEFWPMLSSPEPCVEVGDFLPTCCVQWGGPQGREVLACPQMRWAVAQAACPTMHCWEHLHTFHFIQNSIKPHVAAREASGTCSLGDDLNSKMGSDLLGS